MKNYFFILICLVLFVFAACEKKNSCPDNISLGSKSINFPSKFFMPYSNQSITLVFRNAKNDSIKIKTIVQDYNPIRINDSVLCGDGIDPFNSQFIYHDTEQVLRGFNYNINTANIDLLVRLFVASASAKDSTFYDKLIVRSSARNITSNLELIADARNNKFSTTFINQTNQYRFVADTTWNGKNFKDVYYSVPNKIDNSAIFYNKQFGIICIRVGDDTWVFDRIE
jgi:hypothetical protein